jgi:flagellar protein FlaI
MGEYEVIREGSSVTLRFDYGDYHKTPSIEDDAKTMFSAVQALSEVKSATRIIFWQKRDYEYDYDQTVMLLEVAQLFEKLFAQKSSLSLTVSSGTVAYDKDLRSRYTKIQNVLLNELRADPYGSFILLKRMLRHAHINVQKLYNSNQVEAEQRFIQTVTYMIAELEKLRIIAVAQKFAEDFHVGDRSIYANIFAPLIKPDFMFTKLMAAFPKDGEVIDSYSVGETDVTIFKLPFTTEYIYHIMPAEFKLDENKYELLDTARSILAEHKPEESEFVNPKRMREVFQNIGYDLITELAQERNLSLTKKDREALTKILIRYTVGFGLIEVLLQDEDMQDVSVNSPQGDIPIFIVHGKYNECSTNILPTSKETESWATKLRLISGRSLDEADPILDTELELPGASVRVSAITAPLDPTGLAFSFRRHRDRPWTLPLFMKAGMINGLGAGLISFLIDGNRSFLICGTRSSGKSSFLSSLLVEIMRRYRILTIEDTLELPVAPLRKLGYNIQQLKVASSLGAKTNEVNASDGIRSTLRLGDSALIVGEVRSDEAVALYEAMRVGAAANVVAGTIHGDSPYGVFDRVVNDIGVPKTSFKATDIIVIANPVRSGDGLHKYRRITQITEVRKDWVDDPLREHGFVDLMKYNPLTDTLEPTEALKNGDSEILKTIAGNIKEFAGSWDAIWENILLRAKIKDTIAEYAISTKDDELLEAEFVIVANDAFHTISEEHKTNGRLDSDKIFESWYDWFKREVRKRKHNAAI